jgi:hypothetical protein
MHQAIAVRSLAAMISLVTPLGAAGETVRGVLIDKACYERDSRNSGQKHVDRPIDECAAACAKYGLPLAVLTTDGKVYQITGDLTAKRNAAMARYVTEPVEVTGTVTKDEEGQLKIAAAALKPLPK